MQEHTLTSAILGAHIQTVGKGFRQRDVKFLMDLLWSWQVSLYGRDNRAKLHNTQIQRTLNQMVADSWATQSTQKGKLIYRLSRSGLVGVLRRLREGAFQEQFEVFVFTCYVFEAYSKMILNFIETAGPAVPFSYRSEIADLIDVKKFRGEKKQRLEKEIAYWQKRIGAVQATVEYAQQKSKEGASVGQILKQVERYYPYELNHQKSISQLLKDLPAKEQLFELTDANLLRVSTMWKPTIEILRAQLNLIR